jgi:hypothetical protein
VISPSSLSTVRSWSAYVIVTYVLSASIDCSSFVPANVICPSGPVSNRMGARDSRCECKAHTPPCREARNAPWKEKLNLWGNRTVIFRAKLRRECRRDTCCLTRSTWHDWIYSLHFKLIVTHLKSHRAPCHKQVFSTSSGMAMRRWGSCQDHWYRSTTRILNALLETNKDQEGKTTTVPSVASPFHPCVLLIPSPSPSKYVHL